MEKHENIDEILGIVRCVMCGQRLDTGIACPFCSAFEKSRQRDELPKWLYLTACFLTSPLSISFVIRSDRLNMLEKIFAVLGCFLWVVLYVWWS